MNKIVKNSYNLLLLVILHGIIDKLYVYLYPQVNPIRATLIGFTALVVLALLFLIPQFKRLELNPITGFLAIYSSAFFGALLVQAGFVVTKSIQSVVVHIAILVATYLIIGFCYPMIKKVYKQQ